MRTRVIRALCRVALTALLSLTVYASGPAEAVSQNSRQPGPAVMRSLLRKAMPGTRDLQLILELTEPSVIEAMRSAHSTGIAPQSTRATGAGHIDLNSAEALAYQARIARSQRVMMDRLRALDGVQVLGSTDLVMNAIIARVPVEQYLTVRRLPGVKKVYFSRLHRMNLDAAAPLLNAPTLWARAGGRNNAGHGVKIGIIDSGIDITNPMFIDSTLTPPSGCPKGESAFTNNKVIVARNYINLLSNPQTNHTAVDEVGHGSFVAGCAAGKVVAAPRATISGMAPGAFLGSYKIFGTPGINDEATTAAILAAIDEAVADGMDILNLSLGSLDYVPPSEDPEVTAITNAVAKGVVVVLAAGNDGPNTHTIETPGSAADAIAVGAVSNSRTFAADLHVTGPAPVPTEIQNMAYENGSGPAIPAPIPSTLVTDVATLDGTGLACSPFAAGSLSGRFAFIERGECTFLVKVTNATNAGASGVIVYNNVDGAEPIVMGGLTSTTIPGVMISNPNGLAVKSFLASNSGVTISIDASSNVVLTPTPPDVLTDFSSRGPSADFRIKPDLVAVGANVYSAAQTNNSAGELYDASHFTLADGTSFSTPMVSGAAAGVKQLLPGLTVAGIKSALVNTTNQNVTNNGTDPATIVEAGSGLLDMGRASAASAVFSPESLNFGPQAYSGTISLTQTVTITNVSQNTDSYTISVEPVVSGPSVSLSTNSTASVAPGATTNVTVTIRATAPATGGFQGFIMVKSVQTSTSYVIPYWAGLYVPDSTRILTVRQNATSGAFSNLSDAIAAAQPGNIIEIADSGTYSVGSSGFTLSTNSQGLPLHGLTIRAAAGQTPILDGTTSAATADLQVVGLQNVLLQGLTVNGGQTGIDILEPSPSVPLSVTIDHCNITNMNASRTAAGIVVDNGGDVDITYSTITGSASVGVSVFNGTYLTVANSTIQNNPGDGLDALDSNVQILNSTLSTNGGPGAYLDNCSGTVAGSTFNNNTGSFGDGVQIIDGTLTLTGNTMGSNAGAGVSLYAGTSTSPGPTAILSSNTMQANGQYGVLIDQAQSLQMDGNLVEDNAQGLQVNGTSTALLTNNIVVRSTNPSFGDGLAAGGSSVVRIVNSDFYLNQHRGIVETSGASVSVANSIVSSNTAGDLSGLTAGNVQYSLIGDGTFASINNNVKGDPKFVNPAGGDFTLGAGSPALEAGSNSAANLPFLDYKQQLRVASSNAIPGEGRADMGAIEAGSSFPLNYPLLISGTNSTLTDTFITGFAASNPTTSTVQSVFTAYDPTGALISGQTNPAVHSFASEAQVPILDFQLFGFPFGASRVGGVLASSAQKLAGFFLIFDQSFSHLADGVDVSSQTGTHLFFLRHEFDSSGKAVYSLFNPGVNPANVTATLWGTGGTQVGLPKTVVLAPKGQSLLTFDAVTTSSGYVQVQSDRPITGLEIFGNSAEIAALRATAPGTEARIFFPHIAMNQGYSSLIGVVNTSDVQANLTLTVFGSDGVALASPVVRSLNPGGQLLEPAASLFGIGAGNLVTGYVVVESDQPGIGGFCAFTYTNGSIQSDAAVPGQSMPQSKLLFSHVAHQVPAGSGGNYQTGIALLNPFGATVTYTMRVFDSSGAQVAEKTDTLSPHVKIARLLSHPVADVGFFTQSISLASGHVEVTADYPLLGFELFFTEQLTELATVTAQTGN